MPARAGTHISLPSTPTSLYNDVISQHATSVGVCVEQADIGKSSCTAYNRDGQSDRYWCPRWPRA